MATSFGFIVKDKDSNRPETLGPLEHVAETAEWICGWCGRVLIPSHTDETPQAHFKRCKKSKGNRLLMVFKELRKVQQSLRMMKAEMNEMKKTIETMKGEGTEKVQANSPKLKTAFSKEIGDLEEEIQKETKGGESKDGTLSTSTKEQIREMGVDQEKKMAEVNERVSGVTETISTVVHSIVEGKEKEATSSAESIQPAQLENVPEVIFERLKRTNEDKEFQVVKRKVENKESETNEATRIKQMRLHVKPSPHPILTMYSFNLVTANYHFQPSYSWIVSDIETQLKQKTFELSSEWFQWNGYPVQARAKLRWKEDNGVYFSLRLALEDEHRANHFPLIPQVYYLLKDRSGAAYAKHKCHTIGYSLGSAFTAALTFNLCFGHKDWFKSLVYNMDDSIQIEIYVEPPTMTKYVYSYDGTLEWNIYNYERSMLLAREGLIFGRQSPYFYTGPGGYRVQVTIYERNGLLTARMSFLPGRFDAQLPKSFVHSTTLTLMNREDPRRSIAKTVVGDVAGKMYVLELCPVEEVNNVVVRDVLFCKVSIKARSYQSH